MADRRDLTELAFPKFSDAQMAALSRCPLTKFKRFPDGERLLSAGDCECDLFVVKSGQVEILDESEDPPRVVHVHEPGESAERSLSSRAVRPSSPRSPKATSRPTRCRTPRSSS